MNGLPMRLRKKIKRCLERNKMITQWSKSLGHRESSPKREIHNNTGLTQETRESSNKQFNLTLKKNRKRTVNKVKVNRRKELIKIRVEINEIESRKTIQKINETKNWFLKGKTKLTET